MKICVFGNKESTRKLIENLSSEGVVVDTLVVLGQNTSRDIEISGKDNTLNDLACKLNIKVFNPVSYSLKSKVDRVFFEKNSFDLGLSTGWQRLIPSSILDSFKFGIYGWHGSGFEFPNGRGRSPLNWSIRLGFDKVFHNCFKYDANADDGQVFDTKVITIEESDYISDLQKKALSHILESSRKLIFALKIGEVRLCSQPEHPFVFFPKLNELSGFIRPERHTCDQVIRLIRSCSRPFPGSYVIKNNRKIRIWRASKVVNVEPGTVFEGDIVIKDNYVLLGLRDGIVEATDFEVEL